MQEDARPYKRLRSAGNAVAHHPYADADGDDCLEDSESSLSESNSSPLGHQVPPSSCLLPHRQLLQQPVQAQWWRALLGSSNTFTINCMQPAGRSTGDKVQQQQLSQAGRAAAASKKRSTYQHEAAATASGHTPQVPVNAAAAVAAAAVAAADMHEMEAKRLREENAELADRLAQLKQAYATLKVCLAGHHSWQRSYMAAGGRWRGQDRNRWVVKAQARVAATAVGSSA